MNKPNLFYRLIFKMFKRQMIILSKMPHNELEPQSRFNDERFEFVFYDSNGLAYYIVKSDEDMPLGRKLYLMQAFTKFMNSVTDADFTISLDAMTAAILEKNDKGVTTPNLARIGYICTQLKHRKGISINLELLTELAALYFFREDEAIEFINDRITQEKIEHFNANKELISDFFYSKSLNRLFPYFNEPEATLDDAIYESVLSSKAYINELENYLKNG